MITNLNNYSNLELMNTEYASNKSFRTTSTSLNQVMHVRFTVQRLKFIKIKGIKSRKQDFQLTVWNHEFKPLRHFSFNFIRYS